MKKIFSIATVLAVLFTLNVKAGSGIGTVIEQNGRSYTVTGANLITNPSFDNGVTGWTGGAGGTLAATVLTTGGVDGGAYIVPPTSKGNTDNYSIGTGWPIAANKMYVFSFYLKRTDATVAAHSPSYVITSLANTIGSTEPLTFDFAWVESGSVWSKQQYIFTNTTPYAFLQFRARWLGGQYGFDDFTLAEVSQVPDSSFLVALIAECEGIISGNGTEAFEAAIAIAKTKVSSNDAIILNAAEAELKERLLDYKILNADEGWAVDVTDRYVKNARFTNGIPVVGDWAMGTPFGSSASSGINCQPQAYFNDGRLSRVMIADVGTATTPLPNNYMTQTISKLRKGYYRFGADLIAYNKTTPTDSIYGVYLMCNGALQSVSTHGTTGLVPKRYFIEGVVTDSSVVVGIKFEGTNAKLVAMDNVSLEYMGFNASLYIEVLRVTVRNYLTQHSALLLPGVADELGKAVLASEDIVTENIDTLAMIYSALDKVYKNSLASIELVKTLIAQITELNNLIMAHDFPGASAATAVAAAAEGLYHSGPNDIETSHYQDLVDMIAAVKQAGKDYILSQVATASVPADLTLFIQNPSFRVAGQANDAAATRTSVGWATSNVATGGDFRTGFNQSRTCWNSWCDNFTSMDLHQDITGLPAGVYTVSAYGMTEPFDLNDQHAYVGSRLTKSPSPNMTTENWLADGSGEWEKLLTRKVILTTNDTLRIGFASTHNKAALNDAGAARGQNGWFSATDFEVQYYGTEGTDAIVQSDVQLAGAIASTVTLLGDRDLVAANLTAAGAALTNNEGYVKVYKYLNAARDTANKSIAAYNTFLAGSYNKVMGSAAMDTLNARVDAIYTTAVGLVDAALAKANATYLDLPAMETKLAAYLTYAVPYKEAATYLAGVTTPNAYTIGLQTWMNHQEYAMMAELVNKDTVAAYVAKLYEAIAAAKLSYALSGGDGQDLTYVIVNQPLESTSGTVAPTGWTVSGSKDAITKTGQYFLDGTTKRYFDTWGSGGVLFTAYQKVIVPNGMYCLSAIARTPNTGVCIYAIGDKNYFTEVPLSYHTFTSTLGVDSAGQVSDTYGPLWEAAAADNAIKLANSGKGRGWGKVDVDSVVVTNHELTLGFSSDSTFTGKPFKGSWFSVVDFTLLLKKIGDNDGWQITGIKPVVNSQAEVSKVEYYQLSGIRMPALTKGFNIVKTTYTDGTIKVTKIFQRFE